MPKNEVKDALYRCQQAVIDKVGIENIEKPIKIGVKIQKYFKNSYELINYLYKFGQRNKFIWLNASDYQFNPDFSKAKYMI